MNKNITSTIKYIGVDDLTIKLFENQYIVPNGISYNSYLIEDEKIAIMDTADARMTNEWFANLEEALNGREPDYLVSHHMEPDHAALIAEVVKKYPKIKVIIGDKAAKMIKQFFPTSDLSENIILVKDGDQLSLGSRNLHFIAAPFVHWPEVIVSYDDKEKVLFSADGFGKFGALCNDEPWEDEARRYYINICGKYGTQVQRLLKLAAPLEIETICPLHGPVLKENLGHYIALYETWSKYEPETDGVLIAYASIHGGTKVVAEKVADMFREKNLAEVVTIDLCHDDMATAVSEAFKMKRLVVAASSYDASVFPPMYDFIHHLEIKAYQNRTIGIIENGSWAPTAARTMRPMFEGMKNITIVDPTVTIWSRLKDEDLPKLEALVDAVAEN